MFQKYVVHTSNSKTYSLSKLDRKRWWLNPELSLGFGHPDIPLRLGCENQRNPKRERKQILDDLHIYSGVDN